MAIAMMMPTTAGIKYMSVVVVNGRGVGEGVTFPSTAVRYVDAVELP